MSDIPTGGRERQANNNDDRAGDGNGNFNRYNIDQGGDGNHRDQSNHPLSILISELHAIASQGGYNGGDVVCEVKAQNVLEATAGDIPLAAQLYWDDFLASQHHLPIHHQNHPPLHLPNPHLQQHEAPPLPQHARHHYQYAQPPNPLHGNVTFPQQPVHHQHGAAAHPPPAHFLKELEMMQNHQHHEVFMPQNQGDPMGGECPSRKLAGDKAQLKKISTGNDRNIDVASELHVLRRRLEKSLDQHIDQEGQVSGGLGVGASDSASEIDNTSSDRKSNVKYIKMKNSDVSGFGKKRSLRRGAPGCGSNDDNEDKSDVSDDGKKNKRRVPGKKRRSKTSFDDGPEGKNVESESELRGYAASARWHFDEKYKSNALDVGQVRRRTNEYVELPGNFGFEENDDVANDGRGDQNHYMRDNNDPPPADAANVEVHGELLNPFPANEENDFAQVRADALAAIAESVSISDDEVAATKKWREFNVNVKWREFNSRKNRKGPHALGDSDDVSDDTGDEEESGDGNTHSSKSKKSRKTTDKNANGDSNSTKGSCVKSKDMEDGPVDDCMDEDDDDDDDCLEEGYVSSDDWILSMSSREPLTSDPPVDILWSEISSIFKAKKTWAQSKQLFPLCEEKLMSMKSPSKRKRKASAKRSVSDNNDIKESKPERNYIDDDDFESDSKRLNSNTDSVAGNDAKANIPYTWLNAGFQFADSKTDSSYGLILGPPSESDLGYNSWKTSELWRGGARNGIPPPYHCRSVTALLSIVNGLMYSGACIPGTGRLSMDISSKSYTRKGKSLLEISQEVQEMEKCQNQRKLEREQNKSRSKLEKMKAEEEEIFLNQKRPTKRELESRLADALSSLIAVAVRASAERKMKKLEYLRESKDLPIQRDWQTLRRKLRLCPICCWDPASIQNKNSDVTTTHSKQRISVSYTNMEDIRSYVLANLQSFMTSGGVALFLETIIRIHGTGAVLWMIRKAQKEANSSNAVDANHKVCASTNDRKKPPYLVFCSCEQRHKENLENNPKLGKHRNGGHLDTTPHSHECISIEMISLLLTGRVHSKLDDWSTGLLGLGLLSNIPGQVGRGLTRPETPVWLLRGPTSYSCLWLTGCNDHEKTFSRIDNLLGTVAVFTHWNPWYGVRHRTTLRMVSNRMSSRGIVPALSTETDDILNRASLLSDCGWFNNWSGSLHNRPEDDKVQNQKIFLKMQHDRFRRSMEIQMKETVDPAFVVTDEELTAVIAHPDDQKLYPEKYRLWRYDMSSQQLHEDYRSQEDNNDVIKEHTAVWKPFHRLTDRNKLIVETKLGPKINTIIWTRWPGATIDLSDPEDSPPQV